MSLFSLDNILPVDKRAVNESANFIDIDKIGYADHNFDSYSFIQEGYDFAIEANSFFNEAEREFYSKILGSYGNDNIINESFSSFFDSVKKIIKKFIEWIKKIFKQFAAKLAGMVGSEKYIKKHKNLLNRFSSDEEFEYQGFKFTNIDAHDIPKATACDAFTNDASKSSNLYKNLDSTKSAALFGYGADNATGALAFDIADSTASKVWNTDADEEARKKANAQMIKDFNTALDKRNEALNDVLEDYYDCFRAEVIGKDSKIEDSDFAEELFKLFRDGETTSSSITIDSNFVSEAYRRFDKYKDTIKSIEKNKDSMIKDYQDLEKQLDKLIEYKKDKYTFDVKDVSRSYSSDNITRLGKPVAANLDGVDGGGPHYDQAAFDKMNVWLKKQSTRVNRMCDIHSRAFSAKLEAAKDCFSQDKKILNKAIQNVIKHSGKKD